ncbi:MAG: guanylate kinase [Bacteroidales bacterium]|nr:guanylate kinase [Bacteroidales bacterium]MCF8390138.1 guanylate kinase [Bacteroidales bacterium]
MNGKLIILSAPSGSGKTTIVKSLLAKIPGLSFSISATSRSKRENETDGKDYYFISAENFRQKIKQNEFIEWEEVYPERFYGTLKTEVERLWDNGQHVVFDIDVQGGINLKKKFGERALALFISVSDIKILEQRLRNRSTETEESLKARLVKAEEEMSYAKEFDKIIINDKLEQAVEECYRSVKEFI